MANSSDDRDEVRSKDDGEAAVPAPSELSASSESETPSASPPDADETPSASPPDADETRSSLPPDADEARTTRHTERPVAHSIKPPPPAPSTKRGFVWVAMLGLFGVVGFMLRKPDAETALAARAPSDPQPAPTFEAAPSQAEPAAADVTSPHDPATLDPANGANTAAAETAPPAAAEPVRAPSTLGAATGAKPPLAARTLAPAAAAVPDTAAVAPSAAVPVQPAPFSHKAASASLDQSAKAASTCRRGTDPSGVARAVVSFAPTGRVTAAVISGPPFAGTETGSCIARTLRQTVIPPFAGEITTVAKTVEVQ